MPRQHWILKWLRIPSLHSIPPLMLRILILNARLVVLFWIWICLVLRLTVPACLSVCSSYAFVGSVFLTVRGVLSRIWLCLVVGLTVPASLIILLWFMYYCRMIKLRWESSSLMSLFEVQDLQRDHRPIVLSRKPVPGWLMVSIHHMNQLSTLSIKTAPPVDSILFCQGRILSQGRKICYLVYCYQAQIPYPSW